MIAIVIEKKLRKLGKLDGASVKTDGTNIIEWNVPGVPKPTQLDIDSWKSEIDSDDQSNKDSRKSLKQSARTALNMSKSQFKDFISGLKASLEDGGDE